MLKFFIFYHFTRNCSSVFERIVQVLSNVDCPKISTDWDERSGDFKKVGFFPQQTTTTDSQILNCFRLLSRQPRSTCGWCASSPPEHLLMCAPLALLLTNLARRHADLASHFTSLPEEEEGLRNAAVLLSVGVATSVVITPALQLLLPNVYHTSQHPWSRLLMEILSPKGEMTSPDDGDKTATTTTQEDFPADWCQLFREEESPKRSGFGSTHSGSGLCVCFMEDNDILETKL